MELMVVVTIIAVFAGLALPVGIEVLRDQRSRGDVMEAVNAGRTARARSMGRGSAVLVRFGDAAGPNLRVFEIREAVQTLAGGVVLPNGDCRTAFPPPGSANAPFPADATTTQIVAQRTLGHRSQDDWAAGAGDFTDVTSGIVFEQYAVLPNAVATVGFVDICYSPTGRVFWRTDPTAPLTPMNGYIDISARRNLTPDEAPAVFDNTDVVRRARFTSDGAVRFVTCDPKVAAC